MKSNRSMNKRKSAVASAAMPSRLVSRTEDKPSPASIRLKNILVPVDFSDCSRKALRYAMAFAQQFEATLTLLYVVKPLAAASEYGWVELPAIESQMVENGQQELKR